MKYHISSSLFVLFCIVLCACNSSSVEKDGIIQPAFDLIERQIGERVADIQLEEIAPENGKETFEVEAKNGILTLRGSSSVAICYAFYTYLREACSAMKTWSGERMELPEPWPDFVPLVIQLRIGIGNAGKRKSTGWLCGESICRWLP